MPPIVPSPDWYPSRRPPPPAVGRRLLHLSVLFACLFVLVRTLLVEPFGVPTGSMAPTLLGVRRAAPCPGCGWVVEVGEPGPDARPVAWDRCRCPNCDQPIDLTSARVLPGDRLLVDKTAFRHRPPRRWEVAVFDCPADRSKPYVKRLVGLPGEFVQVSDGDVFAGGQLLRKSLAELREVLVPVCDLSCAPAGGWGGRWELTRAAVGDGQLFLTGIGPAGAATAGLRPTGGDRPVTDWLQYNGGPDDRRGSFGRAGRGGQVHDFVVRFTLVAGAGDGLVSVTLCDGADAVRVDLPLTVGPAAVVLQHVGGERRTVPRAGLRPGESVDVEFAFADRRGSLSLDGVEVVPPLDLPHDRPGTARRDGVSRPLVLAARGADAAVGGLALLRDVHYLPFGVAASGWQLGPGDYFALGDNTANSHDSRTWQVDGRPAPGVPAGGLVGKPFLVHQPVRLARLPITGGLVPTPDWDRLRLLR